MPFAGEAIEATHVPRAKGVNAAATTSGTTTTTSAAYVNMAGTGAQTSFSFTKLRSDTDLVVFMAVSRYDATSASTAMYGVNINSTDYDMMLHILNQTLNHQFAAAQRNISGLAAGAYTVQARWKRQGGTGTLTRDNLDWLSVHVMEMLPA